MFDPLIDPLLRTVADLMASAVKHAPVITAADVTASRVREDLLRSHPLGRAMIDNHVIFEDLK